MNNIAFHISGGLVKKMAYSSVGILGMASLCYPKQTVNIGRRTYAAVRDRGVDVISDATGNSSATFHRFLYFVFFTQLH